MSEPILATYTGAGISAPALLIPSIPLPNGTITKVRVVLPDGVTDGDAVFAFYIDDIDQSLSLTIPDTDDEIDDDGLSIAITEDNKGSFRIIAPFPTELPVSPINFYIYYTAADGVPYVSASSSSAAYLDFKEDTDNGTNRVRLLGPASTADVDVVLPNAAGTVALTSQIPTVSDVAYDATTWNGNADAPTKNAVRDKIESMGSGSVATDAIWDAAGDLAVGSGANTAAKLSIGGALEVLRVNAGATALEWATAAGGGTVTNTGGNLTSNSVVLGAGTVDTKVVAGITTNGTAQLVLGVNTTTLGSVKLFGNTSGDATISPAAVAGTATALTLPAASGTLARTADLVGKQTIYIPASAMIPATTSGAASAQLEAAGGQNYAVLDFDATADEFAHFQIAFPKSWNEGTITYQVFWSSTATDTDGVAWALEGAAKSDNEAITGTWGTPVVVTDDAQSAAAELYVTAESGAVTIGGSPAADDLCFFRISRDVSDGNDDMSEDSRLIGIKLFYTTDAATDA